VAPYVRSSLVSVWYSTLYDTVHCTVQYTVRYSILYGTVHCMVQCTVCYTVRQYKKNEKIYIQRLMCVYFICVESDR